MEFRRGKVERYQEKYGAIECLALHSISEIGIKKGTIMSHEKFSLKPIQILGFSIMVGVLITASIYALVIWKPFAIRETEAGRWSIWYEILDKLILISLWVIGYFGYILYALPFERWSWRRAARSGIEAAVSGAIFGLIVSLTQQCSR